MARNPYTPPNPFRSPDMPVDALPVEPLSRPQRRLLVTYFDHREQPFTFGELARRTLKMWLPWLLALGALTALTWWLLSQSRIADVEVWHYVLVALGAYYLGLFRRDFTYNRLTVSVWPVLREVIDWKKVAERLDEQ